MTKKKTTFKDVMSSKGMEHRNRAHSRSLSRHIFHQNAEQLIQALSSLVDPMTYAKDLADAQKEQHGFEKTHRIMREINRLLHNFLAGAMTLVDHTRVFVNDYYLGTSVNKEFRDRINRSFTTNELTRFVQDLRFC